MATVAPTSSSIPPAAATSLLSSVFNSINNLQEFIQQKQVQLSAIPLLIRNNPIVHSQTDHTLTTDSSTPVTVKCEPPTIPTIAVSEQHFEFPAEDDSDMSAHTSPSLRQLQQRHLVAPRTAAPSSSTTARSNRRVSTSQPNKKRRREDDDEGEENNEEEEDDMDSEGEESEEANSKRKSTAGRKGPVSASSLDAKKARRQQQNRDAAATSRNRKKAYLMSLESKNSTLEEENRKLKQQMANQAREFERIRAQLQLLMQTHGLASGRTASAAHSHITPISTTDSCSSSASSYSSRSSSTFPQSTPTSPLSHHNSFQSADSNSSVHQVQSEEDDLAHLPPLTSPVLRKSSSMESTQSVAPRYSYPLVAHSEGEVVNNMSLNTNVTAAPQITNRAAEDNLAHSLTSFLPHVSASPVALNPTPAASNPSLPTLNLNPYGSVFQAELASPEAAVADMMEMQSPACVAPQQSPFTQVSHLASITCANNSSVNTNSATYTLDRFHDSAAIISLPCCQSKEEERYCVWSMSHSIRLVWTIVMSILAMLPSSTTCSLNSSNEVSTLTSSCIPQQLTSCINNLITINSWSKMTLPYSSPLSSHKHHPPIHHAFVQSAMIAAM